ncbi:MAG: hypothetical protein ACE5GJ_13360 [Gemmatimonadota bacterium]
MLPLLKLLGLFLEELRRRKVPQVAAVYAVAAWAVIQGATDLFPVFGLEDWWIRVVVVLGILGLPVSVMLAWVFDLTPHGLERTVAGSLQGEAGDGDALPGGVSFRLRILMGGLLLLLTALGAWASWKAWLGPQATEPRAAADASLPHDAPLDPERVAVLYFDDFSPDGELSYLANGLTEVLIHDLQSLPSLQVISRNGVKPFRGNPISMDSLARSLQVGSIVEGSVEPGRGGLIATVQLVDGGTGTQIMSKRIVQTGDDLLALRDSIALQAVRFLSRALGRELTLRSERAGAGDAESWALFQRANQAMEDADTLRWARGDVAGAAAMLERADTLLAAAWRRDPAWARVVVARGWVARERVALLSAAQNSRSRDGLLRALAYAEQALRLAPEDPAGLELRGTVRVDLTWLTDSLQAPVLAGEAEGDLRAATTLDPNRARAWVALAQLLRVRGDFAQASLAARHALDADPFLIHAEKEILFTLAQTWLELGEVERASRWTDEGRRRFPAEPAFPAAKLVILAGGAASPADADSAWAILTELEGTFGVQRWTYGRLQVASALAGAGLADSARSMLYGLDRGPSADDPWAMYYQAHVNTQLRRYAEAVTLLEKFLEAYPGRRGYIARDWWWRPLRARPDFQSLVGNAPGSIPPDR